MPDAHVLRISVRGRDWEGQMAWFSIIWQNGIPVLDCFNGVLAGDMFDERAVWRGWVSWEIV